jgi:hypothetical protein
MDLRQPFCNQRLKNGLSVAVGALFMTRGRGRTRVNALASIPCEHAESARLNTNVMAEFKQDGGRRESFCNLTAITSMVTIGLQLGPSGPDGSIAGSNR